MFMFLFQFAFEDLGREHNTGIGTQLQKITTLSLAIAQQNNGLNYGHNARTRSQLGMQQLACNKTHTRLLIGTRQRMRVDLASC